MQAVGTLSPPPRPPGALRLWRSRPLPKPHVGIPGDHPSLCAVHRDPVSLFEISGTVFPHLPQPQSPHAGVPNRHGCWVRGGPCGPSLPVLFGVVWNSGGPESGGLENRGSQRRQRHRVS